MEIVLTPELEQVVRDLPPAGLRQRLMTGRYGSPTAVVAAALRLLEVADLDMRSPARPRLTLLQRMGGQPRFYLERGDLSDRDRRRAVLIERLQRRYRSTP